MLVTGGEGLVGRAIVGRAAAHGVTVFAPGRAECDVTRDPEPTLARLRPDVVLFCAAFTDVDRTTAEHEAVNVRAPARWAAVAPTVFLSSNFVLDGPGPHPPSARRVAGGTYVNQKIEAEDRVLASGGRVARVGWVYGPGGRTFASRLVARLRADEPVSAIVDVLVQPTWAPDLADALLRVPNAPISHHIGGEETSWYAVALAVQARVGRGRVLPVRLDALGLSAPRPRDARLTPAALPGWHTRLEDLVDAG